MIGRLLSFLVCVLMPALVPAPALAQSAQAISEAGIALDTPTGKIAGSLVLPAAAGPVPVALIIAGSGPTDRDGNSSMIPGRNDSLRMLAQALARAGIASVRYDKRGIGASAQAMQSESALRFETYIDDAAAWAARLRKDPRFSKVAVIGHSEGSLIGMVAARQAGADAFVSFAGVGTPLPAVLRRQLADKLPPDLLKENERILGALERGQTVDGVPPLLAALYRPSVQPYLISQFRYVPAKRIAALSIPVLIVQGTTDIQVGVEDAQALKRANPGARLEIVEGMNHVLKMVPADGAQLASYGDPALPLAPRLVDAVTSFLHTALEP
ncbi:alpha/beta hydrolase family protein [Telluria sp. B2]|jgi:pimeloyl-ACP methyl ester carboxylesterase